MAKDELQKNSIQKLCVDSFDELGESCWERREHDHDRSRVNAKEMDVEHSGCHFSIKVLNPDVGHSSADCRRVLIL